MNTCVITNNLVRRKALQTGWPRFFILSVGGILMLAGGAKVISVFGTSQILELHDPLIHLPFRHVMLSVGMTELIIAGLCLFTNKQTLGLRLVIWLVVAFAIYRICLLFMGWEHPYICLGYIISALNVSPLIADGIIMATSAYLLLGSDAALRSKK